MSTVNAAPYTGKTRGQDNREHHYPDYNEARRRLTTPYRTDLHHVFREPPARGSMRCRDEGETRAALRDIMHAARLCWLMRGNASIGANAGQAGARMIIEEEDACTLVTIIDNLAAAINAEYGHDPDVEWAIYNDALYAVYVRARDRCRRQQRM